MNATKPSLAAACAAEVAGTFILVFFGLGAVHNAVLTGSYSGVLQVGLVWGLGVTLGVYVAGKTSGAHLNPAITLALLVWARFPPRSVIPYMLSQLAGAALAALVLHVIFTGTIRTYETENKIVRGAEQSVVTASMYGEYFPNPTVSIHASAPASYGSRILAGGRSENLGLGAAFLGELVGTALLSLFVFALTSPRNPAAPGSNLAPLFVGLAVAALIAVLGPLTQCCLNPARDFGPRIVAYLAGWGEVAFPGPRGAIPTLLVYLVAPLAGGVLGGALHRKLQ